MIFISMNSSEITNIVLERVENLLVEGRLEDVKAKYPQPTWSAVDQLSTIDPSGNNKYLDWLAKQLLPKTIKWFRDNSRETEGWYSWTIDQVPTTSIDPRWESNGNLRRSMTTRIDVNQLLKVQDDLENFHKNPSKFEKKDINQFADLSELEEAANQAKLKLSRKEQKETGVDKVYEDDDFLLLMPKTHKASCRYGSNTRWCVTMRNTSSYFENYFTQGPIFFLVDKRRIAPTNSMDTPTYYKVAIHYRPFGGRFSSYNNEALNLASTMSKEDFLGGANPENAIINYWNVADENKPESVVKKYLGGPGRGQKKKGDETIAKLKEVMSKYTKEAMGKYYDSLGDISSDAKEIGELETKINELSGEDTRLYYQKDRISNVSRNLRYALDRFDRNVEGESEQYDWLVEQLEKSRNFENQIEQKRTELRSKHDKLNEKLEKIKEKIKGDNLVFYDREKNVSLR
jgi:hypothetical protein